VVESPTLIVAGWSLDNRYLFFAENVQAAQSIPYLGFLDSQTGEVCSVGGAFPSGPEVRSQYAWLPGGEKLAISRMNGQDQRQGSTLYFLDGATSEVTSSLPLSYATDQSSPSVEWLTADTLLLDGEEIWWLVGIQDDPPVMTNVMRDIFGLSLNFPGDISAPASLVDPDGGNYHLIVRANHGRDHNLYIHHSSSGQVEVLDCTDPALLIFPDGRWVDMPTLAFNPPPQNRYTTYWAVARTRRL
jgi:hypothetical protein